MVCTGMVLRLDGQRELGAADESWRVFESPASTGHFAVAEVRGGLTLEGGICAT